MAARGHAGSKLEADICSAMRPETRALRKRRKVVGEMHSQSGTEIKRLASWALAASLRNAVKGFTIADLSRLLQQDASQTILSKRLQGQMCQRRAPISPRSANRHQDCGQKASKPTKNQASEAGSVIATATTKAL